MLHIHIPYINSYIHSIPCDLPCVPFSAPICCPGLITLRTTIHTAIRIPLQPSYRLCCTPHSLASPLVPLDEGESVQITKARGSQTPAGEAESTPV